MSPAMTPEEGKSLLIQAVTIVGLVIGIVYSIVKIIEALINIRTHFRTKHGTLTREEHKEAAATPLTALPTPTHFMLDLTIIMAAGVLLNYLGLALSIRLNSILYLDMTGTALVAFLLGPWYAGIVGLISNGVINWLLDPPQGGTLVLFPWALLNISVGILWGYAAKTHAFRRYLMEDLPPLRMRIWYLACFGILASALAAIPAFVIEQALKFPTEVLSLDPYLATLLGEFRKNLWSALETAGVHQPVSMAIGAVLTSLLRFIPDKVFSAGIALLVLRYGFPLYERRFLHMRSWHLGLHWSAPMVFAAIYAPYYVVIQANPAYQGSAYMAVWALPLMAASLDLAKRVLRPEKDHSIVDSTYREAMEAVQGEGHFFHRLTLPVAVVSFGFILVIGLIHADVLGYDYWRVLFNYLTVVYGFFVAMYVIRISVCQNIVLERTASHSYQKGMGRGGAACALFVDVDGVITKEAVNLQIARHLGVEQGMKEIEARFRGGSIGNEEFNRALVPLLRNAGFTAESMQKISPQIAYQDGYERLLSLDLDKYLVSSGPSYYVLELARRFGIPRENVVCSEYRFDESGLLSKRVVGVSRHSKAAFVRARAREYRIAFGVGDNEVQDADFLSKCNFGFILGSDGGKYEGVASISDLIDRIGRIRNSGRDSRGEVARKE